MTLEEDIRFHSKMLKTSRIVHLLHDISSEVMLVPDSLFYPSPCVIHIQAETGIQINVTVDHVSYLGEGSSECKYAGLVIVEELTDEYKESSSLCSNHSRSSRQSRSFYSHNSSLTLVLYWYEPYSVINATLKISQTTCKTIWLDDCVVESLCSPFVDNLDECNSYLRKITRFSKVTLRFVINLSPSMLISLPDKECVVIQIFHKDATLPKNAIDNHRCHVPLDTAPDIVTEGRITYTILGSLHNYVAKGQYKDTLIFHGISDRFCFTHEDLDEIRCQKDLDTPILHPNRDEYDAIQIGSGLGSGLGLGDNGSFNALIFDKIQDIFVFALTKTPTHTKSLTFGTAFYLHTRSWIDVIIQNTEVFHREADKVQYPSETIPLFGKKYSPTRVRSTVSNVLLLRLIRKTSKVKTDLKLLIHYYFVIEYKGSITTWDSLMTAWGKSFKKVISVAGKIEQMTFYFRRQSSLQNTNNYDLNGNLDLWSL